MKSTYLDNLDEMDFTLVEVDTAHTKYLSGSRTTALKVYFGTDEWNDKTVVAKLYPPKSRRKDYLFHYSKVFDSTEINATKYGLPDLETVQLWNDSTPEHFRFSIKVPQYISHQRDLTDYDVLRDLDAFIERMEIIGHKIGSLNINLPSVFKANRLPELFTLAKNVPAHFNLSAELRSSVFYQSQQIVEEFVDQFHDNHIAVSFTDNTERRDMLHMYLSNNKVYIRLMGNKLHPSDYQRIDNWIERLNIWIDKGLDTVYFYVNQPTPVKGNAFELVTYFAQRFNEVVGTNLRIPKIPN
ncbi:DUF72 domain-containing protein [bacterium]|nr:DUF72 domain-containing protein [bacterium]